MTPEQTSDLFMRLVRAEAGVVGLRRALRRLVAAEKEFSRDTGIKLDDLISEAVGAAEFVLESTKWSEAEKSESSVASRKASL